MKLCPECKARYGDDVGTCPKDGARLVSDQKAMGDDGTVAPHDRTAVVDLEALEVNRKARPKPAPRKKAPDDEEEGESDVETGDDGTADPDEESDPERTPPPIGDVHADPEATGTMKLDPSPRGKKRGGPPSAIERTGRSKRARLSQLSATSIEKDAAAADDDDDELGPTHDEDDPTNIPDDANALTDGRMTAQRTQQSLPSRLSTQMQPPVKVTLAPMSPATAAVLVVLAVCGLGAGLYYIARGHGVLTVTTVPPGALVTVDGKPAGMATLQKRVSVGNHTLELELEGYEPFKEIVNVPMSGLSFLQPLRTKPPPPPAPPTKEEQAAALSASFERLLAANDVKGATGKLFELTTLLPTDPHLPAYRESVAALARADDKRRTTEGISKKSQARSTFDEGKRLYENGALGEARAKLQKAIELDARYAEPHRILARIYNRSEDIVRTRHHLSRYIALGGADADFKVREWLKAHPE